MKRIAILFLLATPLPALASPASELDAAVERRYSADFYRCLDDAGGSDSSMIGCYSSEFARHDEALNSAYRTLLNRLGPGQAARLRASQRAWIRDTDRYCTRQHAEPPHLWGSMQRRSYASCNLNRTIRRTIWLERYRSRQS